MKHLHIILAVTLLLLGVTGCGRAPEVNGKKTLRVGHFPNITHAQALVARQMAAEGKDWFGERLGPEVELQWFVYNAGPSAMEGIFTDSVDLTYVGPSPVLNAYCKSRGEEIRVIAGAANGGAGLVVAGDGRINKPEDFRGRKIATPQLGNTQDIAARAWMKHQGFKLTQLGGEVLVLPTANPDQLSLFQGGKLDGVWTVEPWISRLELEAGGKLYLEQKEEVTTVLISSVKALETKRDRVAKFVRAHEELTLWINENPEEAKRLVAAALKAETRREFPQRLADRSWPRLTFTSKISREPFEVLIKEAQSVGFLKRATPVDQLVVLLP
ncbi:MAG: aliphatic sulfonate ABC transporter substrate-binding protein [Verrucomicrobiaceae bacterium]|nr:MAG: aliphatic sulfonate ABC transporter substrate-binding protein [Verrucomicrobiaceae bacterium]